MEKLVLASCPLIKHLPNEPGTLCCEGEGDVMRASPGFSASYVYEHTFAVLAAMIPWPRFGSPHLTTNPSSRAPALPLNYN